MSENTFVVLVVPVPSPQCIDVDEVHAGNRLSLMVTPGGSEEWVKNIATEFTPTIGQTFATLDEGIQFYETYAIACGFEPRKSSTKRFRSSGDIRTKLIVCHREGFRDSKPTILPITGEEEEPMVKASNLKKTKVTRIGCKARIFFRFVIKEIDQVQVPFFVVDQFHASHNHRLSPLKYREFQKKCRNLALQHKQTIVDNCKVNIGPTSTFRSVKEYVDGYENIGASLTEFKNFGREIKCFIGLKDAQMFVDQLNTFMKPGRRQRWIPAYYRDISLGCLLRTTQRSESANSFFKRFENPHGTLVEFWMRFQSAMDQQRYTQTSLDRDSDHSLPQTKTLLSLEVHASTVYTHALFYEFQQQCVDYLNSCSTGDSSREGSTRFLEVEDSIFNKTYTSHLILQHLMQHVPASSFERKGYICKHIIRILSVKGSKRYPISIFSRVDKEH
ncbi:uncharacterized protein LOC141600956 [Silene latifolia]|uniref:uncharacterized protein LOC141600956 n=1 Tax=Silene latifolia TaxID=37657 RepID=UPI003D77EB6A